MDDGIMEMRARREIVSTGSAKWELLMLGQWVLSLPGDAMAAMVTEGLPGRWLWQAQGKDGTAASREAAIAAAEAHLPNTQVTHGRAQP